MSDVEDVYDHLWPKKHTEHPGGGGGGGGGYSHI